MFCPVCQKDWSDNICDGEGNKATFSSMAENMTGTSMSEERPIETPDTCAICHNLINFDGFECLRRWIDCAVRFSFDLSNEEK